MPSLTIPSTGTLPTILFVCGAWHEPWCFDLVRQSLADRGFESEAPALPTVGTRDPNLGLQDDAQAIRTDLEKLIDDGKEVILVAHSYGGIVASNSVEGLNVKTRASQGLKGGVSMIVFLCAFTIPAGATVRSSLGGNLLPWYDTSKACDTHLMRELFYHDVEPLLAETAVALIKPQPYRIIEDKSTFEPWLEGFEVGYIFTETDKALPLKAQKLLFSHFPKGSWSATLAAAHSPFLNVPDELGAAIEESANFVSSKK
ncbi:Alpha/beta hydrolase fold-1 [Xylariaceae sp. FL1019]|nr:Alpha/beta hydrolase fold-1 [Xylariaceae sp. FL1019]